MEAVSPLTIAGIARIFAGPTGDAYHPVATLSTAIDRALSLGTPFTSHLLNVIGLALAATLLFLIIRRLPADRPTPQATLAAWLATALFLVVPATVDSLTTLTGRPEILAAMLGLGSFLLYHSAVSSSEGLRLARYALALVLLALALLSHASALVFPALIFLLLVVFGRREGQALLRGAALFLPVLAVTLLTVTLQLELSPRAETASLTSPGGAGATILAALDTVSRRAQHLFVPVGLSTWHPVPRARDLAQTLLSLAHVALAAGAAALLARNRRRRFATLWLGVALLASNAIFPRGAPASADRDLLLAAAGLALLVASLADGARWKRVRLAGLWALVAGFSLVSFARDGHLADERRAWDEAADRYPKEALPELRRGELFFRDAKAASRPGEVRALLVQAADAFDAALARDPSPAIAESALSRLGVVRLELGDAAGAESAMTRLIIALDSKPHAPRTGVENVRARADALATRGDARELLGRRDDAIADLRHAAALAPADPRVHERLGSMLRLRSQSLDGEPRREMLREAAAELRRSLAREPHRLDAALELASALHAQGELIDSMKILDAAKRDHPGRAEPWLRTGALLLEEARAANAPESARELAMGARAELVRALEMDSRLAAGFLALSDTLALLSDDVNATQALERAYALAPRDPEIVRRYGAALLHSGAAALAEGDLATAEERVRAAVTLVPGDARARARLGDCLEARRRYEEAQVEFERALTLAAEDAEIRHNAALFYKNYGYALLLSAARSEGGVEHDDLRSRSRAAFERAVALAPGDGDFEVVRSLLDGWTVGGK